MSKGACGGGLFRGGLAVVLMVLAACGDSSAEKSQAGSPTTSVAPGVALTRAMSFPGTESELVAASIGAPTTDVELLPFDIRVRVEPPAQSVLGFELDSGTRDVEAVLLQFGETNEHLRVLAPSDVTHAKVDLDYEVSSAACKELCARPYVLQLFSSLELSDGALSEYAQVTVLLDCTDSGDPKLCTDDDRAQTSDAEFLAAIEKIESQQRTVIADAGAPPMQDSATPEPVNLPPTADAGAAQQVDEGALVTLSGSAADSDGSVAKTSWKQLDGVAVQLAGTGDTATFTAPAVKAPELLTFAYSAQDDDGVTVEATVTVSVLPVNAAPTVDAGSDMRVDEAAAVTLTASAQDSDGSLATIAWQQIGGPTVSLSGATTLDVSFTAPNVSVATSVALQLTVTDDEGASRADIVVVTVDPIYVSPSVAAGSDQSVNEGALVNLAASASDADGTLQNQAWQQRQGPSVTLTPGATGAASFTAPAVTAATLLVFAYVAQDDDGLVTEDTVTVSVLPVNAAPTVDAGGDFNQNEGASVVLSGTAQDSDGSIALLAWQQIGGPNVTLSGASTLGASFTAPSVTAATSIVLQLTATDDEGASSSDVVIVTIDPNNLAPSAGAGPDQSVIELVQVQLAGSASDSDGTVTVHWRQLFGPTVSFNNANVLNPIFTAPDVVQPQTLRFELVVTDNEGAVALDQVDVLVSPSPITNVPPSAYAGPDQVAGSGGLVALAGVATDADGSITSVIWTEVTSTGITINNPTSVNGATFTAPNVICAQQVILQLEVQDDLGGTATDRVAVMVLGNMSNKQNLPLDLDLEASAGGIVTGGALGNEWAWGVPTTGPLAAHSGTRVWATQLAGNYRDNANDWLCLPPVDLGGAAQATLSFRLWVRAAVADGVRVQALDPNSGWTDLTQVLPAYADSLGWRDVSYRSQYLFTMARLPSWVGSVAQLRVLFQSNVNTNDVGAYVDDLRVNDEASDPDGDGLPGVWTEYTTHGTDPFLADTDGDGDGDGAELGAGSNPLNAAMWSGASTIVPGTLLDFEQGNDGGLSTDGTLWQHGTPSSGPGTAHSGTAVWATNLSGNYSLPASEHLYLPPIDLTGGGGPATLSFRIWSYALGNHGTNIEYFDGNAWQVLAVQVPGYDGTALGKPAFTVQQYLTEYVFAAASLAAFEGSMLQLRFTFSAPSCCGVHVGAYLDDMRVDLESSDPDADGIAGVLSELSAAGTDPTLADSDGDGVSDGDERSAGTDPLDPSSKPGVVALVPGAYLDFQQSDGGLSTDGTQWEYGSIASGPLHAHAGGTNGWATELSGSYFTDAREYLYLPPLDLTAASDPTLSFRLWSRVANAGVSLEVREPGKSWVSLAVDTPAYNRTDPTGKPAWGVIGYRDQYVFAAANLVEYAGERIDVRFAFRSACCGVDAGAYIDELRLDEETSDPDADGIDGVVSEYLGYGTDPYLPDSDGDGESDGDELALGANPLNPAFSSTTSALVPGAFLDFEANDGGLRTDGLQWQYGDFTSGPGTGHGPSDSRGWATNIAGNYFEPSTEYLYLPPIDLTNATDPTLSYRIWSRVANAGVSMQILNASGQWVALPMDSPVYNGTDSSGAPAYKNLGYLKEWTLAAVSLAPYVGDFAQLRFVFRSGCCGIDVGSYIDHLRLDEESADPDGDGLDGVLAEMTSSLPSDPYAPDTDSDGALDGAELAIGANPMVGSDYPGGPLWTPGTSNSLETNNAGLWTDRALWQYGAPASGPCSGSCVANTGSRVWATNLSGNYFIDAREYLYLPPLDLSAASTPTLGFFAWCNAAAGNGMSVEVQDPTGAWINLASVTPAYNSTDGANLPAWNTLGSGTTYVPISVNLSAWSGGANDRVRLRLAYRTRCCAVYPGCYLDDFSLN